MALLGHLFLRRSAFEVCCKSGGWCDATGKDGPDRDGGPDLALTSTKGGRSHEGTNTRRPTNAYDWTSSRDGYGGKPVALVCYASPGREGDR